MLINSFSGVLRDLLRWICILHRVGCGAQDFIKPRYVRHKQGVLCIYVYICLWYKYLNIFLKFISDYVSPKAGTWHSYSICNSCFDQAKLFIENPSTLDSEKSKQEVTLLSFVEDFIQFLNVCPETTANRVHLESKLFCGVPNRTTVDDEVMEERLRGGRYKRVVGGIPAKPVSSRHTVTGLLVMIIVFRGSRAEDSLLLDSDPVANCSGGEQKDWLWRSLYRRMLGTHRCPLCQVMFDRKWLVWLPIIYQSLKSRTIVVISKKPLYVYGHYKRNSVCSIYN